MTPLVLLTVIAAPPGWDPAAWDRDAGREAAGLAAAGAFRASLLEPDAGGGSDAGRLGALLEELIRTHPAPPPGRPGLGAFAGVTAAGFVAQLRDGGRAVTADAAFAPFAGRWAGRWEQKLVDHHWHPVAEPATVTGAAGLTVTGRQYAWVGDGFGWNYVVTSADAGETEKGGGIVLGHVWMLAPPGRSAADVTFRFPLVGHHAGPGRLIWVTPDHIFFEEVLPGGPGGTGGDRYAITGTAYAWAGEGGSRRARPAGSGFRALYIRPPAAARPPFIRFDHPAEQN